MTDDKFKEMLMHLIVNQYAEMLTLKDLLLADLKIRNGHIGEEDHKKFMEGYDKMRKETQQQIIDGIKKRYESSGEDLDELFTNFNWN